MERAFFRDDVNVWFAGIVGLVLAAVALVERNHRRRIVLLMSLAVIGIVLSFGPATSLYRWLYEWVLPLRGIRAAARFGYLYLIAVALLGGLGAAWLERRVRSTQARLVLAAALIAAVSLEAWQSPVRTQRFTGVPAVYPLLADAPGPVMLVEVPFYPPDAMFENGEYVLNATGHWRPVMNGMSGATPMSYRRRAESFWFFPRDWAIDAIKKEGATHVMVHLEKFGNEAPEVLAALNGRSDFQLVASDAVGHRLYRLAR